MAVFTYTPDFGAQVTKQPSVRSVKFSDGYEQRIAYGLNTAPQSWNLSFAQRTDAEAAAIEAFLSARNGVEAFDWTPPNGAQQFKFICRQWTRSLDRANLNTVSATFEQVFDL
jgi:phage-related protein